ncbi:hypothetical protein F4804DRAFT_323036 [Jackrogersella minutella]|nr:hypothetical protein F4804DRAFT_323036 [Jackrogersella minutella]
MSRQRPNFIQRFVPDMSQLSGFPNGTMSSSPSSNGAVDHRSLNYESTNLNDITRRHMSEDIRAYTQDKNYCQEQLNTADLTPQEMRTLQIRILDCGHNIRHCQHRLQLLDAQARRGAAASSSVKGYNKNFQHRASPGTPGLNIIAKRKHLAVDSDEDDDVKPVPQGQGTSNVQRLGFWKCRLCTSKTFLDAGQNRVPSAPCKWPLKDVSKILNHFLSMHTEHSPEERCQELGDAFEHNRGPFEYWLTRSKGLDLEDSAIDYYIATLQSGELPEQLRGLSPAANEFPNAI